MPTKKKTSATKKPAPKAIKVEILKPVAGAFLLPYNVGQIVELPQAQAEELIAREYAKQST